MTKLPDKVQITEHMLSRVIRSGANFPLKFPPHIIHTISILL